jgi:hypothetical protein
MQQTTTTTPRLKILILTKFDQKIIIIIFIEFGLSTGSFSSFFF